MDVENIIKNSKTLKQLTKDISAIAKNQGDNGGGGVTGINRVDNKIDDIKNSIANNSTVQFFKDPAGALSKGISGVIKPFAEMPGNLLNGLKNLNPFGLEGVPVKKALGKLEKSSNEQTKLLKQLAGVASEQSDEIADSISEGLGQTVLRDQVRSLNLQESSLGEITRLRLQAAVLPERLTGFLAKPINSVITRAAEARDSFFARFTKGEDRNIKKQKHAQAEVFRDAVQKFGKANEADTETQMIQRESHFVQNNGLFNSMAMALTQIAEHQRRIEIATRRTMTYFIGGNQEQDLFDAGERARQMQDQKKAEAARDADLKVQERHEELIKALSGITGDSAGKESETSKKAGGIFDWIKKNFMGIGGGAIAGGAAVTGGISGLFLGMINTLTEGFRILGRRKVMVTRGAGVLAIMGLSLLPFAGSIAALNKALNGLTLKKVGVFGAMLTVLGVAIAGFSAAIATGIGGGVVAGAIGLLGLLGVALIPFGKALELAGAGLEPAAELFTALTNVKWSSFFLAGPALTALASSLRAFKGLPDFKKGDDSSLDQISQMGAKIASTLPGAATPIKDFETAIGGLADLEVSMGIGNGLKNIYEATNKRNFKSRLEDAGLGMKSLLSDINSELNKLNMDALNKVSGLLSGDDTMLTVSNQSGPLINSVSTANGVSGQPIVVVDNSTGGTNTQVSVTQQVVPHTNDSTLQLLAT